MLKNKKFSFLLILCVIASSAKLRSAPVYKIMNNHKAEISVTLENANPLGDNFSKTLKPGEDYCFDGITCVKNIRVTPHDNAPAVSYPFTTVIKGITVKAPNCSSNKTVVYPITQIDPKDKDNKPKLAITTQAKLICPHGKTHWADADHASFAGAKSQSASSKPAASGATSGGAAAAAAGASNERRRSSSSSPQSAAYNLIIKTQTDLNIPESQRLKLQKPNDINSLGWPTTFTKADVKKTKDRLALKFHPDQNPNNPTAAEAMTLLNNAYGKLR